jgi:hypothetical protein
VCFGVFGCAESGLKKKAQSAGKVRKKAQSAQIAQNAK